MRIIAQWIVVSLVILATPYLVTGVTVDSFGAALAAAAVLGILNAVVKPVLFFLTLPITVVTLGLFYLVLNAFLFQWAGAIVSGLHVATFWAAFVSSLLVSAVSWALNLSFQMREGRRILIIRRGGMKPPDEPTMRDLN